MQLMSERLRRIIRFKYIGSDTRVMCVIWIIAKEYLRRPCGQEGKSNSNIFAKECASKNKSPPPCIWQDSSVRSYVDIYQPAGKGAKKSNMRHEMVTL